MFAGSLPRMRSSGQRHRDLIIIGLGEALFDCFPDRSILGGAPLNFVVHAQQLLASRGQGVLVSRIGNDDLGKRLLHEAAARGVQTDYIQIDDRRPTGTVQVTVSPSGDPSYEILEGVAWDHLEFDEALERLSADCSAVCFGTLAQRSATTRETIQRFLSTAPHAIRLLDVNLRQHYITPQVLESSFKAANVVKLNEGELARAAELLPQYFGGATAVDDHVAALRDAFDLRTVALTRGSHGTVLYSADGRFESDPVLIPAAADADGVGAGDACCAGLVYGLLNDWPPDRTLELANRMGAYVASQPGGTPRIPQSILDKGD
jgi:fructokinase